MSSGPVTITGRKPQLNQTEPEKNQTSQLQLPQSGIQKREVATSCNQSFQGYTEGTICARDARENEHFSSFFSDFFKVLYFLQDKSRLDLFDVRGKVVCNDHGNVEVFSHGSICST